MVRYCGVTNFNHARPGTAGVLLTNLGTPTAPTRAALKKYLGEFLLDPRVIEAPRLLWWLILNGIILQVRPQKSARGYREIWTDEGSPLLNTARQQLEALRARLQGDDTTEIQLELGMRYGSPSIRTALESLRRNNVQKLLVFPLYPQYSAATTASTFDALAAVLKTWRWLPELRMVRNYHDNPAYISALAESVRERWQAAGRPDKLLISFHGLPRHYFLAGDPYFCECHKTARLLSEQLELEQDSWEVSFQSRFGPREWLKPYTDKLLQKWGKAGVEHVQVICPGFSADCLETLEEIQVQNRHFFLSAGGRKFSYIPALNDTPAHIAALHGIIREHTQGWFGKPDDSPQQRQARAQARGAQA